jgi:hypothetical protein
VGLTARTAASFCVFLTLETPTFFAADAPLRATGLAAAFRVLAGCFGFAVFLAEPGFAAFADFAGLRAAGLAALARFALGLVADFALTARFSVLAVALFAFERVGDRRKPFVRLLLMGGISKGCSTW